MALIPSGVFLFPEKNDYWIIMNIFSKTSLAIDHSAIKILNEICNLSTDNLISKYKNNTWNIYDVQWFSNEQGLLADPTRYQRKNENWKLKKSIKIQELINEFYKNFFIIDNKADYSKKFQNKTSLLDTEHFGNFHQQLGQHLILNKRENSSDWWVKQKFNDDFVSLRNNLYHAIQGKFLKKYFTQKFNSNDKVLDLGCGVGYYSNMIAKCGASVMGIDPNENYIEIAKKNAVNGTQFEIFDIGTKGSLDNMPTSSVDYVFMSDALLFYFVSFNEKLKPDIQILFNDIHRILKPNGTFINLEPHYIFWLLPWLGTEEKPYTILTEYLQKSYGVTPTISQLIQSYSKGGFQLNWMEELTPDPTFEIIDKRGYNFAKQFPLWHLFELTPKTK
jgi:SAM-dependent methyltransferase